MDLRLFCWRHHHLCQGSLSLFWDMLFRTSDLHFCWYVLSGKYEYCQGNVREMSGNFEEACCYEPWNTNTNTNTPVKIWSNTNTNTAHQIQIQIQIHTEAETKLPPFYRWHIQIHCTVRRLFQISLKIVSKGPIYHKPPLAPIMAWRWVGNKPLSDLWWPSVLMHKCITQPKWVNVKCSVADCYLNVV